jgi:hypothetical protein
MSGYRRALAVVPALLVVCALALALSCSGQRSEKQQAGTPPPSTAVSTLSPEQFAEIQAMPYLGCENCPPKAEVVSDEELGDSEAMDAIDGSKEASDLYASADALGYHDVLQGRKTTYSDGTIVNSALIRGDDKGVAILATGTGSISGSVLVRLDPANADQLIVTDAQGGSATVTWAGQFVDSQETHNSCHYWHCVGAAVSWLYSSTWYADWLGAFCHQCSQTADEITCGICLASLPSGLLASVADCGYDSCDYCDDDSCADDVVTSTQCRLDPSTVGTGLTPIYAIYQAVDDYSCLNPGQGNSQCVMTGNVVNKVQVCPGDCASDSVSCAPATPRACDTEACAARSTFTEAPHCTRRTYQRWTWYEVWWTGTTWSCQADGAGGSVCVPGPEGSHDMWCPDGWGCNNGVCTSPAATPTRTPRVTSTVTPTPAATLTPGPSPTRTRTPRPTSPFQRK